MIVKLDLISTSCLAALVAYVDSEENKHPIKAKGRIEFNVVEFLSIKPQQRGLDTDYIVNLKIQDFYLHTEEEETLKRRIKPKWLLKVYEICDTTSVENTGR